MSTRDCLSDSLRWWVILLIEICLSQVTALGGLMTLTLWFKDFEMCYNTKLVFKRLIPGALVTTYSDYRFLLLISV